MPVSTKFQVRRDTAATWTSTNPTLASGEIGFETDTLKFKIGNGSTAWTSLGYQAAVFNGGTITNALVVSNTGGVNTSGQFISTIATSNAPFIVSSTTQVANLNVATSGSVNATVTGTNSANLVYGSMGDNDQFRIQIGATATNAGFVEIATADDGTEPIHVRQYTGVFATLARTATILDGSGNTTFPGTVSGTRFISNVSVGTAPFTVTSTTQVANLNVAISGSTSNVLGGAAGSLPYQSAANTTTYLARTATNNSTLAFNSSTNAPFWVQPTLSNTYYAATTSAQLAGVVSDETGSGALVFGTTPTITPANAVAATSASTAGYIGMPQVSVNANTAILATHAGKHIYTTVTGLTHTIPANSNVAFEVGTAITFVTASNVSLSIALTTDTLRLANSTSTGTRTLAANGVATALKITSNVWIMSGNGLT
jgi:hypothetical protein